MKNLHKLFLLAILTLAGQICDVSQLNATKRRSLSLTLPAPKKQKKEGEKNRALVHTDRHDDKDERKIRLPREIMQLIAEFYFLSLTDKDDFETAYKSFLQATLGLSDKNAPIALESPPNLPSTISLYCLPNIAISASECRWLPLQLAYAAIRRIYGIRTYE